jgi:protoporphyrinogen oxidase
VKYKYILIGSGPTGLGAAYRLQELGETDFVILEQANSPGGLAASFVDAQGFTWDIGGHVQFSHYSYFDQLMLKALGEEGWLHHQRESWVWMKNRFVPYPFQNNIRYLPKEAMWKCLEGIIKVYKAPSGKKPRNFKEWIFATFGEGIAQEFMLPYNFKVWAHYAEEMAYQWIGERVSVVDLQRVTQNVLFEQDDLSWGPNKTFQFPRYGGTGAIWEAVAKLIGFNNFRFQAKVTQVSAQDKTLTLSDGQCIAYEHLLSTVPLDCFVNMVETFPECLKEEAQGLKHSSSNIVGIGLKGQPKPELKTKCWMYFPESDCPFYRVTVFSNYSPNNVPNKNQYWSLMTETSESLQKLVNREYLIEETIQGLLNTQLIEAREDIVSTWLYSADYGYPTPSVDRDDILNKVIPALEQFEIYSRGRFGAWKYEVSNQDHSLMQGVEWVNKVVLGIPEITYPYPEVANSNWGKHSPLAPMHTKQITKA